MKSILSATVCAAAMAFAVPAMAQNTDATTTPTHHHHRHHAMRGKHAGMRRQHENGGDAETARLNEQSLQNAKGGAAPAGGAAGMTSGTATGSSGAGTGTGTGTGTVPSGPPTVNSTTVPPHSTNNGMATGNDTTAPMQAPGMNSTTAPGTGMAAPSSGSMGSSMQNNAPNSVPSTTPAAPATTNQ